MALVVGIMFGAWPSMLSSQCELHTPIYIVYSIYGAFKLRVLYISMYSTVVWCNFLPDMICWARN